MHKENVTPIAVIAFYGKRTYVVDETLARKVGFNQTNIDFAREDVEDESSNSLH